MYLKHKQLGKINGYTQLNILREKFNIDRLDLTFGEMGFDELDNIEFVMELEKRLNIVIPDDIIEHLTKESIRPIDFTQFDREEKLTILGL